MSSPNEGPPPPSAADGDAAMAAPPPPPPMNATTAIQLFGLPYLQEYNGRTLVNVAIAFIVINTILVGLRFFARIKSRSLWKLDDIFVLCGYILCIGCSAQGLVAVNEGGVGHHIERVMVLEPEKLTVFLKLLVAGPAIYSGAVLFPRLAICIVYLQFFTDRIYRMGTYIIMFLLIGTFISVLVADLVQCDPLAFVWDPTIEGGHCPVDANLLFRWSALPNIITDVAMLLLPMPYIWKLPTDIMVRLSLASNLAMGSVGLITSIVRFSIFFNSDAVADGTWSATRLLSLAIVEPSMYLAAACFLSYRPLVRMAMRKAGLGAHIHPDDTMRKVTNRTRDDEAMSPLSENHGSPTFNDKMLHKSNTVENTYPLSPIGRSNSDADGPIPAHTDGPGRGASTKKARRGSGVSGVSGVSELSDGHTLGTMPRY